MTAAHEIFGANLFDGAQAQKGYGLDKLRFLFNHAAASSRTKRRTCAASASTTRAAIRDVVRKAQVNNTAAAKPVLDAERVDCGAFW